MTQVSENLSTNGDNPTNSAQISSDPTEVLTKTKLSRAETDAASTDKLNGLPGPGILAGSANVIMQLALPAVGYGVYESRVDSGNLFKHPIKRQRTTLSYLAVAYLGKATDRSAYRKAIGKSHAQVRSTESSPVQYNAFDPKLQLWVAACLYRGWEDVTRLYCDPSLITEEAYQQGSILGTTLQMPREMWPATRADFEIYWNEMLSTLSIDEPVRLHLLSIARGEFLPKAFSIVFGRFLQLVTTGFLPEDFRKLMQLPWSTRDQKIFDTLNKVVRAVHQKSPEPIQNFPFNFYLWDIRRRIRKGLPLV